MNRLRNQVHQLRWKRSVESVEWLSVHYESIMLRTIPPWMQPILLVRRLNFLPQSMIEVRLTRLVLMMIEDTVLIIY